MAATTEAVSALPPPLCALRRAAAHALGPTTDRAKWSKMEAIGAAGHSRDWELCCAPALASPSFEASRTATSTATEGILQHFTGVSHARQVVPTAYGSSSSRWPDVSARRPFQKTRQKHKGMTGTATEHRCSTRNSCGWSAALTAYAGSADASFSAAFSKWFFSGSRLLQICVISAWD